MDRNRRGVSKSILDEDSNIKDEDKYSSFKDEHQ
jgi:hypothetical protein